MTNEERKTLKLAIHAEAEAIMKDNPGMLYSQACHKAKKKFAAKRGAHAVFQAVATSNPLTRKRDD